jgi:hypothetical protein
VPNIARTTPRPPARPQPSPRSKILLVRQPVKSVRRSDEGDRTAVRLAIGVIVALGVVGAVWLMGYLGWRLGFAPIMRVPDLRIEGSGGIATGTLMLIGLPRVILEAGIEQPMWLMVGFGMICIPAASLGAIKTPVRGGPKIKPAVMFLLYCGAVIAMLNAIGLLWWTASPMRNAMVKELPINPAEITEWLGHLRIVGGLDALGVVAGALWVVVAMRIAVPMWLRALASSVCMFVLVVMTVAFSVTNATIAQATSPRSIMFDDEGEIGPALIVGSTPEYLVTMHKEPAARLLLPSVAPLPNDEDAPEEPTEITVIEMSDRPTKMTVTRRQSIADYLLDARPPSR